MQRARLLRLGLFQLAAGSTSVIFLGVVNRVMRVELGLDVFLVSLLVGGGHYLGGLITIPFGHYSDTHPVGGYRRSLYALVGALAAAACLAAAPAVVFWIAEHQGLLGYGLGFLFFFLEGLVTAMAGTAYLALIADLTTEKQRGPATGVVWTLLMVGIIVTGIGVGVILNPYSATAFITLALVGAALAGVLTVVALARQEPRLEQVPAALPPRLSLGASVRLLLRSRQARWFGAFLLLSLFSFFMQDVILEPFGGEVFHLDAAQTARFNAYLGTGVILGMLLGGLRLIPRFGKPRITALGCWLMAVAFALLAASGLTQQARLLPLAITLLGFSSGLFTVGGVAMMMDLTAAQHTGLFAGAWTLVRSVATGPASVTGGALVSLIHSLGATAGQAYAVVFALEGLGVLIALLLLARVGVQRFQREVSSFGHLAAEAAD
jgi:BCD family chlorophyll transporter-like MFS transporter